MTSAELLDRVRALTPGFRERAATAEAEARLPRASVDELLDAGVARILAPRRFGGAELGLQTWLDVVLEVSRADASHGWCASLIAHHPHYVAQFPEAAQEAVWAGGPDLAIATSLEPRSEAVAADGGYRVSGRAPYTSGVLHSSWILVGAMLPGEPVPTPALFLVPPGEYAVEETWLTSAMRATGSNTAVTDGVLVPADHVLRLADMREGRGPGGAVHAGTIYRAPWMSYAPVTFAAPILGAAQGALEELRARLAARAAGPPPAAGPPAALPPNAPARLARAAADLDASELLLRRILDAAEAPEPPSLEIRARSMRDMSRSVELSLAAVDVVMALAGSSGFATADPIQRAWRDAHFAASHISLSPEANFAHWGRTALGLERPADQLFY